MAYELGSGLFGLDSDITSGSDVSVLPDVSFGGPAEQPSTAAGNGFGEFFTGLLSKGVDYAIAKDAAQWNAPQTYRAPVPVQQVAAQQPTGAISNRMLIIGGIGLLALLVLGGSKN